MESTGKSASPAWGWFQLVSNGVWSSCFNWNQLVNLPILTSRFQLVWKCRIWSTWFNWNQIVCFNMPVYFTSFKFNQLVPVVSSGFDLVKICPVYSTCFKWNWLAYFRACQAWKFIPFVSTGINWCFLTSNFQLKPCRWINWHIGQLDLMDSTGTSWFQLIPVE